LTTQNDAETLSDANKSTREFIVVSCRAWAHEGESGIEYFWNGKRYRDEATAIETETQRRGHDDFLVAEVADTELVAICERSGERRVNKDELTKIAEHIYLDRKLSFSPL
jgi:hypothetical protein